jgi:two-component system, LytTR family, response regulator
VVTRSRRILSTTSLARFEAILPSEHFVRAHRSQIVRLAAVTLAEPAGNARLLLHLEDGTRITTSRAGAKRLRELAV